MAILAERPAGILPAELQKRRQAVLKMRRLLNFWASSRHCRESEENRRNQAPENPNGTRNPKTGERWVLREGEGPEPAHRGQAREDRRGAAPGPAAAREGPHRHGGDPHDVRVEDLRRARPHANGARG